MNQNLFELVYPETIRNQICELADIYAPQLTSEMVKQNPAILYEAEVIFSGWGGPRLDQTFLEAAPNLKALFYGAGSIKHIATELSWKKNIVITSAVQANAIPVTEFALSQILFCLKNGWQFVQNIRENQQFPAKPFDLTGTYQSTVGLISLGTIGRRLAQLLKNFDVKVIAYDPFADQKTADHLGVSLCSLEDLFKNADIISLHTPLLDKTRGMIRGDHFSMMRKNASFINTARGAVIRQNEMIEVLKQRHDITAVLDVTNPEPPEQESPLYTLPNVILTPHLAGSAGNECARLGAYMLDEFRRYLKNEPLKWEIYQRDLGVLA